MQHNFQKRLRAIARSSGNHVLDAVGEALISEEEIEPRFVGRHVQFATYVGKALHHIRRSLQIKQYDLATEISKDDPHVTQSYISRVERGDIGISLNRLRLFCRYLKCKPHQVLEFAEKLESISFRTPKDEKRTIVNFANEVIKVLRTVNDKEVVGLLPELEDLREELKTKMKERKL